MDFFSMKRKKLQTLCKKHGIPANLKNKDMAEKLSLIYKEGKNENPGSSRLQSDADKSNVEIIILDSDSDSDLQMEDTVAEKDEKTNVSAEHEEPDQVLTSSPLSEVKSDFNVPHTDDSGIAVGNADAHEMKLPAPGDFNICDIVDSAVKHTDEVKSSDLNNLVSCPLRSDEDKSNFKITVSDFDIDTDGQMEASDTVAAEKDSNEKTDVRAGHLLDRELDLTPSPLGLEGFGNYYMLREFQTSSESTDIHEDTDVHQGSVEQIPKFGDYHCAISQAATTCLYASSGAKSTDDNTNVNVENTLDEVHSSSFGDSDGTPVRFLNTNLLNKVDTSDLDSDKMVVTGTTTKNAYTSGAKFELSQKMCISPAIKKMVGSSTKLLNNSVSPKDIVFHNVEESIQIGADKEQVDPSQEKMTEFSPKLFNNPGTPTNGDIELCGLEENFEIGVNKENINPNENVMLEEPSALVMSHNEDLIHTVSEELGNTLMEENLEIDVNKNIDHNEDVMHAEPSANVISKNEDLIQAVSEELDSHLMEDDIGICGLEENFEIGVNKENIDPNEDVMLAEPCDLVMSHNEDLIQTVSEELGNKLMEENLEVGVNKENIDHDEDAMHAEPSANVISKNEDLIQAVPEELDCNLMEDDIGICGLEENFEIGVNKENIDPNEDVMLAEPCALVMSHNEDLIQTVSEELGNKLMEENLEVGVNKENIDHDEDVMHAEPSAMAISKNEVLIQTVLEELDCNLMEDEIVDENLRINIENIDPSDEVLHAERSFVFMSDDEEVDLSTYQMDALESVAEKDSSEKTNVRADPLLDKEPDQFLTTSPLSEIKSRDLNVQQTIDSGTAAGNADVCEVKPATPSDHNVHDMIDSGTATKSSYTSGAKFESSQKMSTSPASKEIVGSSTKLLNDSVTPIDVVFCNVEESVQIGANKERVDPRQEKMMEFSPKLFNNPGSPTNGDVGFFGLEEYLEIGVDKENIDPNEDAMHAEPSAMVMSDNEDLIQSVSEELGTKNADTSGVEFESSPKTSLSPTPEKMTCSSTKPSTATKNADTSAVRFEPSPKMSLNPTPEKMIGSSTKLLGVNKEQVDRVVMNDNEEVDLSSYPMAALEACEEEMRKSSEKTCMVAGPEECIEFSFNDLEASTTKGSEAETYFESTALGDVMETCNLEGSMQTNMMEEENNQEDIGRGGAEDDNSGANSYEEVKADELAPAVPQSSEMESCDFGLQELFAQGTALGDEYENQAYLASQKRKRSDMDDTSGASSEEEGKSDELVPTVPQSSEIDSYSFSLQQLFAQDTASGGQDACQNSPSKTTPIASGEKNIIFTPKFNESSMMRKEREISMIEEENNQEEEMEIVMIEENNQEACFSAQPEVSKFFDTSNVHDDIDLDGPKDESQACSMSRKRKMSEVDSSGATSDEEVKADELFPAVAQSSEIESRDFCLQQLLAQDGPIDENQACSTGQKRKMSEVDVTSGATSDEEVKADELLLAVAQSSEMESGDFGLQQLFAQDGPKDENQAYSMSRKRRMSEVDVTSGANSDEEVKADELFLAVEQSSEMESRDFGLQQHFAQDTASEVEDAYQEKLDSSSTGTPIASGEKNIIFTPKLHESSMMHKKMRIEMNLSQKPAAKDSDMKENIKIDKKEDVSSTVLRNKFAKRLPLQNLHQN